MFIDTAEMMFASRIEKLIDNEMNYAEVERGHKYVEGWDKIRTPDLVH